MVAKIVNQHEAVELINKGFFIASYQVVFDNQPISQADIDVLVKHGIDLPDELNINHEELTVIEKTEHKTAQSLLKIELKLNTEILFWIQQNKIDINALSSSLISDFYKNYNSIKK